jgi:hypothetical protein
MILIELFCGHGEVTRAFRSAGHHAYSYDIRKRKGICEPSLREDIMKLQRTDFPHEVDVVWASPPCTSFSYGAGNFYYKKGKPNKEAINYIQLLRKTLKLIHELRPVYYFIENPRGRMRYNKDMIDFLAKHDGCIKPLTLSSYGFPTIKPTDIFTNCHAFIPRQMDPYGRGHKNPTGWDLSQLTVSSAQRTPPELALDILNVCIANMPEEDTGTPYLSYWPSYCK